MTLSSFKISIPTAKIEEVSLWLQRFAVPLLILLLVTISIFQFVVYYQNGLGLAYNDARSHLNIGRRVVEGLKPGAAQLGSVWLPLTHVLMIPTIWNDFMWHSGLSGAIQSMISYVLTGYIIYKILARLKVGAIGRITGLLVFALNMNILYLQSTAMTELLLLATMTMGSYQLIRYHQDEKILSLIKSSFWIMLSTLIRYDGWFLFFYAAMLLVVHTLMRKGYQKAEGIFILFCSLAGFGIFLWLIWNGAIFKDPLYFAFGPYSAHAQQSQLDEAGVLQTKFNLLLSIRMYGYALIYNSGAFQVIVAAIGTFLLFLDKKINWAEKRAVSSLYAPLLFNVLALFLGHSVLFIQGISGNTWFNVRYGIMMMPSIAVLTGYTVDRLRNFRPLLIGLLIMMTVLQFANADAVTIDDGRVGSSQKNVGEVSNWINQHAAHEEGFVLISAASHDAIIFSSGLPMKRYIHEGTGAYWESATTSPDRWARWIIMRTNDENDQTFKLVKKSGAIDKYQLVQSFPFADIYQLKKEFLPSLQTEAVLGKQK